MNYSKKEIVPWINLYVKKLDEITHKRKQNLKDNTPKNFILKNKFKNIDSSKKSKIIVSVIGKPNVGKSTLINSLINQNRMVTDNCPGTTQDSVFIPVIDFLGNEYFFIDTAGVRKRKKIKKTSEKNAITQTFNSIKQSNIVMLITDPQEYVSTQNIKLLNYSINIGRPVIVVINKYDTITSAKKKELKKIVLFYLKKMHNVKIHYISALLKIGINSLFKSIQKIFKSTLKIIKASDLTKKLHILIDKNPPPIISKNRIKLKFAHPCGKNPIKIVIYGNQTQKIPNDYKRYLLNNFIKELNLMGVKIKILFKNSVNPYIQKNNNSKKNH